MNEFLAKYGKYLVIGGITTFLILVAVVIYMIFSGGQTGEETNQLPPDPNALDYTFLEEPNYSREDQYLLLTSKILVEEYGTYSNQNLVGLLNVQNQSTESFQRTVSSRINSINSQTSIVTEVDPNSLKLTRLSDSSVEIVMTAVSTDLTTNQKVTAQTTVQFVKQGEYWLISNIISE